ncbi:transglycosylase domain-containing protein [Domibacillus enclensis]|uniref:Monofunctional biosynthetic peptidoglycan transglycosylase n=1 Tax=Domibacillus enclensis TaxID=1017273 RepID=A0A1N6R6C6_9BACI|nr:transglycosylase domain-containing protein [Domibacillus enclensis]OXS78963.1 monofunctional biosynthetic peptidoglycan transglycosylase [Domibacillus enclensis]SIQ24431.1 penicillin-binding protein, 1A family [Domibacillus enclensis]
MKKWLAVFFILIAGAAAAFFYALYAPGPPDVTVPRSTLFYAADGTKAAETHSGEKRYWVKLDNIAPSVVNAVISIEDKQFYDHFGLDPKRIAGAALADLKAMAKVQGASTITQQYARNVFLTHDKTWTRKLKEAWQALRIEAFYSKDEILEGYLNTVYFGHGAYGVEAASQFYFGKSADALTVSESALLAGIPKGPSIYSPLASREKSEQRRRLILSEMNLPKAEYEKAIAEIPDVKGAFDQGENAAPYFIDAVRTELEALGFKEQSGLKVYTTLNFIHQEAADQAVADGIEAGASVQSALVSIDPKTHYVTALSGGRDYAKSPFNRAVQAFRQPGSLMKPFLYYAALQNGFTPVTKRVSEPTTFNNTYSPKNFNSQYAERGVTMAEALAVSDNIYAVKTNMLLEPETLVKTMKQFGVSSELEPVPSLALGTSGMTVLESANAYATIASGGVYGKPVFITKVEAADGTVLYRYKKNHEQRLDEKKLAVLTRMMTGMFDETMSTYAAPTGAAMAASLTRPYAGKSGSTPYDYWMAGFTPALATVVWTGYDDGSEITKTEDRSRAKVIWSAFMEKVHMGQQPQEFKWPRGLIEVEVDVETGTACTGGHKLLFERGTEPTEECQPETDPIEDQLFPELPEWFR